MKLPNKLSALIKIALVDLGKAERSKKYTIYMGSWHEPNSVCRVCFAGAVMAFSLGTDINAEVSPYDFGSDQDKFFALNSARKGSFNSAQFYLTDNNKKNVMAGESTKDVPIPKYSRSNPKPFKLAMRKAARRLEAVGL